MGISLIISTYNWPEALNLCLKSVLQQDVLPEEIVIADDGSTDTTRQLIDSFRHDFPVPIKHIWQEDAGFRKTIILNKAAEACIQEYIVQIDGDVILNPYFIKDHLASAEPSAFVRGTRALLTPEKTSQVLKAGETNISPFDKGVHNRLNALRIFRLRKLASRKEMSSRSVRGSNLAFWKSDFIKVNGYNNDLLGWGHEDEELAARFINNNIIKKIIKFSAVQYHLYHQEQSRESEPEQRKITDHTSRDKTLQCVNGYRFINNYAP